MSYKKIIILGPPRSGTTLLGKILSQIIPNSIYIEEPNVIWRYSQNFLEHEEFSVDSLTRKNKLYIRNWFDKKVGECEFMIEKTPANALRPNYVNEIFPDAFFIFLFRSGKDVVESSIKKWKYEYDNNAKKMNDEILFRQLRIQINKFFQIPFRDYPRYFEVIVQEILFKILNKKRKFWGPRFKGYNEYIEKNISLEEICFEQWKRSTEKMLSFLKTLDQDRFKIVNYNELISNFDYEVKLLMSKIGIEMYNTKNLSFDVIPNEGGKAGFKLSDLILRRIESHEKIINSALLNYYL